MPLSGEQMLKLYKKAGWKVISQKGSHVKMGKDASREIIPIRFFIFFLKKHATAKWVIAAIFNSI